MDQEMGAALALMFFIMVLAGVSTALVSLAIKTHKRKKEMEEAKREAARLRLTRRVSSMGRLGTPILPYFPPTKKYSSATVGKASQAPEPKPASKEEDDSSALVAGAIGYALGSTYGHSTPSDDAPSFKAGDGDFGGGGASEEWSEPETPSFTDNNVGDGSSM